MNNQSKTIQKPQRLAPLPEYFPQPEIIYPLNPSPFSKQASLPLTKSQFQQSKTKFINTKKANNNSMNTSNISNISNNNNQKSIHNKISKGASQASQKSLRQQLTKLRTQLQAIYKDYLRQKAEHEYWRKLYKDGQLMYHQLEQENSKLIKQIQQFKNNKKYKIYGTNNNSNSSSSSIIGNKKQIPIIKINVPSNRALSVHTNQQDGKQSVYRQLKSASQQLTRMKNLWQSQKQKAEFINSKSNKNLQQLTSDKNQLIEEVNKLKEENSILASQNSKLKNTISNDSNSDANNTSSGMVYTFSNHDNNNNFGKDNNNSYGNSLLYTGGNYQLNNKQSYQYKYIQHKQYNQQKQQKQQQYKKMQQQLQSIKRIHFSCNILLNSKQIQITNLNSQINSLKLKNSQITQNNSKQISRRIHDGNSASTTILDNTINNNTQQQQHQQQQQYNYKNISLLQKHVQLSTNQMQKLDGIVKQLLNDFINKCQELKRQNQRLHTKNQSQKYQLERVYQMLNDKKKIIEVLQRDFAELTKNKNSRNSTIYQRKKSSPSTQEQEDQYFRGILKERRDISS